MTPAEFIMLKSKEVKQLVLEAWEPYLTPQKLIRKIVPRSFDLDPTSKIHKGLIVWTYTRGVITTVNCIYLDFRIDFMISMLTGEVYGVDMAIRGEGEYNWEYYKVKDDI